MKQLLLLALALVFLRATASAVDSQPPGSPQGLIVYSFGTSVLKAQWNAAGDNVGVTGYRLDVATDAGFTNLVSGYNNLNVGNFLFRRLLGLSASTTYYVRVRAYDAAGNVSANSATGDGRTRSLPAYPVADFVKTGWAHWSHASGDCVSPLNCGSMADPTDDSNDFDDSFGEHNGSIVSGLYYKSDPDYVVLNGPSDNVQFDFATPNAGDYTFDTTLEFSSTSSPMTISTCPGAGCPSGIWTTLGIATSTASGMTGQYVSYPITIPPGQTVTRFRIAATLTSRVHWAVLKAVVANNAFTQLPPVGTHPRLSFDAAGLTALKARAAVPGTVENYLATDMFAEVDRPFTFTVNFTNSNQSHDIARVLLLQSLAVAMTDPSDPKYATRLANAETYMDHMLTWTNTSSCAQTQSTGCGWGPDLWNANTQTRANVIIAFAIAYDTLYNVLDTTRRTNYATRLYQEADLLDSVARGGGWTCDQRINNLRPWFNAAIGVAGLALDNNLASTEFINATLDQMVIHLDTMYDPLGGYGETAGYYSEAFSRFTAFADALVRAGGFNLFPYHNSVAASADRWILDMMIGDASSQAPMGDTDHGQMRISTLATFIGKYSDGLMKWMFDYVYPPPYSTSLLAATQDYHEFLLYQTLLYYNSSVSAQSPAVFPLTQLYNVPMIETAGQAGGNSGYWFARSSWTSKDALYLATQCGDDQGVHGHADHGSLFFSAYQQILLDDFGKIGDYGSASEMWHYLETGHNAVMIDGKGEGHDQTLLVNLCTVTTAVAPSFLSLASMDSTSAYGYQGYNAAQSAKRHALVVNTGTDRGYLVTIDDVTKDANPHDYKIRYLGCDSTNTGSWCPSSGSVAWSTVAPNHLRETGAKASLDVFVAEPPSTTITTGNQYGANYLDIDSAQTRGMYVNLLFPTSTRLGVTLPTVTTIRDTNFSGFTLNNDTVLFHRTYGSGTHSSSNVSTDGEIAFVRGTSTATQFMATKATTLSYQGAQYLSASPAPNAVAVEYTGWGLTALLDLGTATTLTLNLASQPVQVQFIGESMPYQPAMPYQYAAGQVTVSNLLGRGRLNVITNTAGIPTLIPPVNPAP